MFMGLKLDSWTTVTAVYTIIFIATILQGYYSNVVEINLHSYVWSTGNEIVPFNKIWSYLVLLLNPFVNILLYIIRFYATATFQLQYIIPQFVASYIVDLPFTLKWLGSKKFIG